MEDKLQKLISKLDTAAGMLVVAAMDDATVKQAKQLVSEVSFELGNAINDFEGGGTNGDT